MRTNVRLRTRRASTRHDDGIGLGPDSVEVSARHLCLGGGYATTLIITGYPAEVGAGWLEPLLCYPGRVDVATFVDPLPPAVAADRLRRQLGRLESGRRAGAARGRLEDFEVEAATADARDMAAALARGEIRLFRVALYLTVHATTLDELRDEAAQVRALASSMLLQAQPASFRALQGWASTLPLGVDSLRMRRAFDTPALSAAYPFTSPDLPNPAAASASAPRGILYGLNASSGGLVVWDRWAQDNYNSVVLARSGAGKSYLTKLEALRSLYLGVDVAIIDPEDEYRRPAEAVGGAYLRLGAPGVHLNPFDLPHTGGETDAFTRRALFLHTLIRLMLTEPISPASRAALDRAITATYAAAGITSDPRTWRRPAPLLRDLAATLTADTDPAGHDVAARLAPYVSGSHSGLFTNPTTMRPESHFTVISLKQLPDELKPVGTLLGLDAIWRQVTDSGTQRRRLVIVDEAWLLMRDPEGAKFLFTLAKRARKHWTGLSVVTQDAADVLGSDLGLAIVSNATTQILLRQAPQAIDTVAQAFRLSDGERAYLLAAARGDGLLVAGTQRVAFTGLASEFEHAAATTDPAELAALTDT